MLDKKLPSRGVVRTMLERIYGERGHDRYPFGVVVALHDLRQLEIGLRMVADKRPSDPKRQRSLHGARAITDTLSRARRRQSS